MQQSCGQFEGTIDARDGSTLIEKTAKVEGSGWGGVKVIYHWNVNDIGLSLHLIHKNLLKFKFWTTCRKGTPPAPLQILATPLHAPVSDCPSLSVGFDVAAFLKRELSKARRETQGQVL